MLSMYPNIACSAFALPIPRQHYLAAMASENSEVEQYLDFDFNPKQVSEGCREESPTIVRLIQ